VSGNFYPVISILLVEWRQFSIFSQTPYIIHLPDSVINLPLREGALPVMVPEPLDNFKLGHVLVSDADSVRSLAARYSILTRHLDVWLLGTNNQNVKFKYSLNGFCANMAICPESGSPFRASRGG
jgi:hypothetical protein